MTINDNACAARRSRRALVRVALLATTASRALAQEAAPPTASPPTAPHVDRARAVAESLAVARLAAGVPGIVIAMYRDTTPLFVHTAGLSHTERQEPMRTERSFPIASVTKQFAAVAILRLAEAGQVELDTPAARYGVPVPDSHRGVTVRQLLHQTSGLGRVEPRFALVTPSTADTVWRTIARVPTEFAPGERFAYNNANYIALGIIIQHVTGVPWDEYVQRTLLAPLGLRDTRPCAPAGDAPLRGYRRTSGGPMAQPAIPIALTGAAGALCSTPHDLARWTWALHHGGTLRPASYSALTTPPSIPDTPNHAYAMGQVRTTVAGRRKLWHNGALTSGFQSQVAHYPDDSLTIVVLANSYPAEVEAIELAVYRAWRGLPAPPVAAPAPAAATPVPADAPPVAAFVGVYTVGPLSFEIREREGGLAMQPPNGGPLPLVRAGALEWRVAFDESFRVFFDLEGGTVAQLRIDSPRAKAPPARRQR